ncbi:MAG: S24 family peptidase [Emergencia sp.]|nr:S24 family peptidase [Emergencia sp.]
MTDSEQRHIFSTNLNLYLSQSGLTQKEVADKIGVSPQTFNTWCKGIAIPRMGKVQMLSDFFGIHKSDLIDKKTMASSSEKQIRAVRIPVLGEIVAGLPIDAYEEILDWEEITPEMAATGTFFALRVKGDSMSPRISAGDVVIIRQQDDIESGDIAVVFINGNGATLKKVMKQSAGITLVAFNPAVYEPQFYTNAEIESLPIKVAGKVVELRAKF